MASLSEFAKTYEPPKTKNIADLKEVEVTLQLEDRTGKDESGDEFKYKVIVVNGEDYRVPGSVIGSLKAILEKKPTLSKFSVSKVGTGMNTKYTVIPIE
jgi:hypothetical protein